MSSFQWAILALLCLIVYRQWAPAYYKCTGSLAMGVLSSGLFRLRPALFLMWLIIFGSSGTVLAAGLLPRIPAPDGFVDGATLSEKIRTSATVGQPPSVKLIGMYYQTDTLADILNRGYSTTAPFCKALLKMDYQSIEDAKDGFRALVESLKRDGERKFDVNDPAIKRIMKRSEDAARSTDPSVTVKMGGMEFLGTVLSTERVYASALLVNFNMSDGTRDAAMPFVASVAWMRLGKQQVEVSVMYPFQDAKSIETANRMLLTWVKEIERQNPEEEKSMQIGIWLYGVFAFVPSFLLFWGRTGWRWGTVAYAAGALVALIFAVTMAVIASTDTLVRADSIGLATPASLLAPLAGLWASRRVGRRWKK